MSRVISVYSDQARRRVNAMVRRLEGTPHASPSALEGWADTGPFLRVANESGADFYQGDVVELKNAASLPDTELDDFLDRVTVVGVTPTATIGDKWGLATTQIADRDVGPVAISGVRVARVNVTDEAHTFAVPTDGQTYLTSAAVGDTLILDRESGLGIKWAYVVIRAVPKTSPTVATFTFGGFLQSTPTLLAIADGQISDSNLPIASDTLGVEVLKGGFYHISIYGNYTPFAGAYAPPGWRNSVEQFASFSSVHAQLKGPPVTTFIQQDTEFQYFWTATLNDPSPGGTAGAIDAIKQCFGASHTVQIAAGDVVQLEGTAEFTHLLQARMTIQSI